MSRLGDVVERVKARVNAGGRRPVVVFDLDGTLFDNGPRTWQILVNFAESEGHAPLRRALDAMPRRSLPYLLRDTMTLAGHGDDAELVSRAAKYWAERFFTDEYQRFDEPVPGAQKLVSSLFDAGATLVYLSGRDAPNMLVGCTQSLRAHGFPVGLSRTALVLKHAFEHADIEFKRDALHFMDELGDVAGTFDNEPANCNLFASKWPSALHFFVATSHAPDPPSLHPNVASVPDLVGGQ
jgi:hypothetical protein